MTFSPTHVMWVFLEYMQPVFESGYEEAAAAASICSSRNVNRPQPQTPGIRAKLIRKTA